MNSIDWGIFSGDLAALILGLTIWLFTKEPAAIWLTMIYAVCMLIWHLEPFARLNDFAGLV